MASGLKTGGPVDELPGAAALGLCTGGTGALVGELVVAAVTEGCAVACAGAGAGPCAGANGFASAEQLLQLRRRMSVVVPQRAKAKERRASPKAKGVVTRLRRELGRHVAPKRVRAEKAKAAKVTKAKTKARRERRKRDGRTRDAP